MNLDFLKNVDPLLAEKIKRDFDLYEIRGHSAEIFNQWISKAIIIEATLFLLRNDAMDLVGVTKLAEDYYEPKFVLKLVNEDDTESSDPDDDNFESNEIDFE